MQSETHCPKKAVMRMMTAHEQATAASSLRFLAPTMQFMGKSITATSDPGILSDRRHQ
jgi:purine nucleoside permease